MPEQVEDIGVLLVHGMGEQGRLDHLKTSAREIASFVADMDDVVRISIVETLVDPKGAAASAPGADRISVDAVFRRGGAEERVRLHLHEVWWADLGISGGLWEQVKFWLWGLGQWGAQVVRKGNPTRNTVKLMANPQFSHQRAPNDRPSPLREIPPRLLLFGAALLAILTFFSWSAAKQVVSLLSRRLPEPSLIFMFLGDVKIYERPGGPGKGTLLDPDMPMRATIRRRMVRAMTAVAAREDYDRWYLFAHSLGTVPAFNALQETELALPNYLSEDEWQRLPRRFRTNSPFVPPNEQPSTDRMMPRRPPWLKPNDGIDRRALFQRFAGFLTYGSPLDKFAALWPRVVPLNRQAAVFQHDCEWVNLYDPTDPVAARLDAFRPPRNRADRHVTDRSVLFPRNFACRASLVFGLSHIRYFVPRRRTPKSMPAAIVESVVSGRRTSLTAAAKSATIGVPERWARGAAAIVQVAALAVLLSAAASALLLAIGRALPDGITALLKRAIGEVSPRLLEMIVAGGLPALAASAIIIIYLSLAAILLSGVTRMIQDATAPPHR